VAGARRGRVDARAKLQDAIGDEKEHEEGDRHDEPQRIALEPGDLPHHVGGGGLEAHLPRRRLGCMGGCAGEQCGGSACQEFGAC
jgi:hypothetical protein